MTTMEKINYARELSEEMNERAGTIVDADTVLADIFCEMETEVSCKAEELFRLYEGARCKSDFKKLFAALTGVSLDAYMDRTIAAMTAQLGCKKTYAVQVAPEYQTAPSTELDNIVVVGPDHTHVPQPLITFKNVQEVLECGDLADMLADETELIQTFETEKEAIRNYLPPESGVQYSDENIKELVVLVLRYSEQRRNDCSEDLLCKIMAIVTGDAWGWKHIRGSTQDEWANIFYPASGWDDNELRFFEACYFNTGTEWNIHDGDDEPASPNEIEGYSVYCVGDINEKIREEIAEKTDTTAENVVLFAFAGWTKKEEYQMV